ncbi:MAG: flavodoxin [Planctomycetota bacterium]
MKAAILWGSVTGSTEEAARTLHRELSDLVEVCEDVSHFPGERVREFDVVFIGVSTWNCGDLQYDWADRLDDLSDADWSGRTVAFFGGGDALGYPDTFVDSFGILWDVLEERGARLIGKWPRDGYDFVASKALCSDGRHLLGLPIDDDNQPELTDARLQSWAQQVRGELRELGFSVETNGHATEPSPLP